MARPKSTKPKKQSLNLTVDAQTRMELDFISENAGESISALVSEWAHREARRVSKAIGKNVPDADQLTLDDTIDAEGNVLFDDDFMRLGGIMKPVDEK